ncbi:thioesterase domain-containing protein [Streptomyces sp. NPDC046805]|uniref:thioesterase II family protein n=1 Tax=Streptomyces sp. NPDC046805 TaxID=3155134 RepID=UPI0033C30D35
MVTGESWLPLGTHPDAGIRLLCLPHAGAGASVYKLWGEGLPPDIKACPVQPPGRERRRREKPFTDVRPLAGALAKEIAESVPPPYALFGHSTGALCAFEVLRELRRANGPLPVHLFVSGRCAPQFPMTRHDLAAMGLAELTDFLRRLGGTPEEVLADPGLLELLQPLLAADFSVNEDYAYVPEDPLDIPITAFAGIDDRGAGVSRMEPWHVHTSEKFTLHALQGGHFAVFDHAAAVQTHMVEALLAYRQ